MRDRTLSVRNRKFHAFGTLLALLTAVVGCSSVEPPGVSAVFYDARAYTVNPSEPWAEAVAVDNKRIVYVGDTTEALKLAGPNTELHDLNGQMLLPGFIDSHMHPVAGGAFALALSLDTGGSVESWVKAIEGYASANPALPVVFGYGFLASTFGPKGPLRSQIDAVVSDRPVLIMDEGFHGAWANTRALEALNITRKTPDPVPGFSYYKRDENGDATGYLLEGTAGMAMDALDVITEESVVRGTKHVVETLNSYGVTSVFDAGAIGYGGMLESVLRRLESSGDLTVRIVGSYRPEGPEDIPDAMDRASEWRSNLKGERYHYRMLKIMDDGTVEGRTAAMFEDYQGEPGNAGVTVYTQAQMDELVAGAAARNIDVHIHALGERAIHEALNAIETARGAHAESKSRYTICHIQVITDEDLPRFAELDVIAQSTPLWASYDTYGKQFVSEDQFRRFWRFNSLKKLGVRLTWGSDYPASGAGLLGMSPVVQIEIGRTRQNPGEPDAPVQPRATERLDLDALIRGYTLDAAYQLRLESEIGSLEVGKRADLVVLDRDLFNVPTYEIHQVGTVMTVLGGEIVYRAEP